VTRVHRGNHVDWPQVALDCGYFDQAHFIHEFRSFSGLTPTAYQAAKTPFQNHVKFLQSEPAGILDDAGMADVKNTYRTLTPYLLVPDADAELTFLKAAFGGSEVSCQRHPDKTVLHAEMSIGDSLVMLGQAGGEWKPRGGAFYLWVDDVDATYQRHGGRLRRASRKTNRGTATPFDKNGVTCGSRRQQS
jgi:uncharacterized glyoxalase superfamily protein PhnB